MSAPVTHYSREISDVILDRMSEGESLRSICREESMPNRCSVLRWVRDDEDGFKARYDIAVDLRAQALADQMLEIANTPVIGEKVKSMGDAIVERTTGDAVDRSRLQVDALKWTLARMAPKRYGDKITQEISGPDGVPIQSSFTDSRAERFYEVKTFVAHLRETVPDPEIRARIIEGLPEEERKDAGFAEMIADSHIRILKQATEKGFPLEVYTEV